MTSATHINAGKNPRHHAGWSLVNVKLIITVLKYWCYQDYSVRINTVYKI